MHKGKKKTMDIHYAPDFFQNFEIMVTLEELEDIFFAIRNVNFPDIQRFVRENPETMHVKDDDGWTPFDYAIRDGKLEMAQFFWVMGGRPNLENYSKKQTWTWTPVHGAAFQSVATMKWIFAEKILPLCVLKIKDDLQGTPFDSAIACGKLEMVKYLWEMGGRPNLEAYSDGEWTPMHRAVEYVDGHTTVTLKWTFAENVLPLRVLNIKDHDGKTPLDWAIFRKKWEHVALFQHLLFNPVCLAIQLAKRDYQCILRRLPDELLDTIVEEVAARFYLKMKW